MSSQVVLDENNNCLNKTWIKELCPHKSKPGTDAYYDKCVNIRKSFNEGKVDVLCDGDGSIPDPKPFCQNVMVNASIKAAADSEGDDVNRLSVLGVCVCLIFRLLF